MDNYLLLLLASLFAVTVIPSNLPQNEFGPISTSGVDAINNSQPKQLLQSIPLDSDSVGGSIDQIGTGEGTSVLLNYNDGPAHASIGYHLPPSPKSLSPDLHRHDFLSATQVAELSSNPELAPSGRRFYCCTTERGKVYCNEMLDSNTVIKKYSENRADTACYGEMWDCPVVITTGFSTDCLRRDSYQTNEVLQLLERYSVPALIWFYRCLFLIGEFMECVWPTGTWDM